MAINNKCHLPVFIAEFSYPSGEMSGAFAGWNKKAKGYDNTEEGQAAIYRDVIAQIYNKIHLATINCKIIRVWLYGKEL
ncbi:hypothetical protein [Butyrivibrio sp. VCD2006]|uniref:hypothetical protein n=1 Tax=Butyrivibrio sp. VCD2006 TaxID=1280664 RepID=UPI0003F8C88A|nr:hypothetical protein [Butyrivibrio sp. VCD2006]